MAKKFLTIQDAADLSKKSVQTIRRAVKSKKLVCKKQRTPQGFNYMISHESLSATYHLNLEEEVQQPKAKAAPTAAAKPEPSKQPKESKSDDFAITADDFRNFTKTLDRMVTQHSEERQNFMRLVNTLQEKIFVIENQMNLLKEPQKKWYHVWK